MVEGVVQFPPELQPARFAPQREILQQRDVPVVQARPAKYVLGGIPEAALRWASEGRRVKPPGEGPLAVRQSRPPQNDHPRAVTAARNVGAVRCRVSD